VRVLFGLLLACCALAAGFDSSSAGSVRATAVPALAPDAFLASATVTTQFPTGSTCHCQVVVSCANQPKGFDCAEPLNCCHCAGSNPPLRKCMGNTL